MAKSMWVMTENGWRHRPRWKVAVNSIMRAVQFWTDRPLLVATKCMVFTHGEPYVYSYCLSRVQLDKGFVSAS